MAHSGGGGSHSSGHHGPSHHTHTRASSTKHRRGSGTYYHGARRYVYYTRYSRRPSYYYSDRPLKRSDFKADSIGYMIMALVVIMLTLPLFLAFVTIKPKGTLTVNPGSDVYVEDNSNIINDNEKLYDCLQEFQEKSGVTVCMVTFPQRTTTGRFLDEAMDDYYNRFSDEKHWLIYYVGELRDRSDNWNWELICGDECHSVLNSSQEDKFTVRFQKGLEGTNPVEDCVIDALSSLRINTSACLVYTDSSGAYGDPVGTEIVGFMLFPLVGIILLIVGIYKLFKPLTVEQKAKIAATVTKEAIDPFECIVCPNCSGEVVLGTAVKCPYCGADLGGDR